MATVTLPSANDSRNQQHDANANTETAPITQEYILTQIANSIKVRSAGGSSYADFNFSIFKSGKYTDLLLYYAGLVSESDKKTSLATEASHYYYGIPTQNKLEGKEKNWWAINIADYLTSAELGYKWTFLYYRDADLPFGFRVSWSSDTSNSEKNPIWAAQNKDFPHVILPENRFVLQQADKVEVASTLPAGQEETSNAIKNICTIVHNRVHEAAKLGKDHVLIPWTAFGSSFKAQMMFIALVDDNIDPDELTAISGKEIHDLFNYGTLSSNLYPNAKFRTYNINELKTSKNGVAPIVFFESSDNNSDYHIYSPSDTNADTDTIPDFSMQTLFQTGAKYKFSLYATVNDKGQPYCEGIVLSWNSDSEAAKTIASAYYEEQKEAYERAQVITYNFEDIPTKAQYDTKIKQINSMYMSKLIQVTCDKMRGAFEQSERWIHILWTDIDAKYPDKVRDKWLQTSSLTFDGGFTTSLHQNSINNSDGLAAAYNTLMKGHHINGSAISTSALSNGAKVDAHYIWAYTAYKDVTGGSASNNDRLGEPDESSSCGIAVYLGQADATESVVAKATERLAKILKTISEKEDPAKKKK